MGKTLYLETSSGISGDMFVAAMIDLGADPEALERALNSIPADGFIVEISSVKKSGIACCDFNVHAVSGQLQVLSCEISDSCSCILGFSGLFKYLQMTYKQWRAYSSVEVGKWIKIKSSMLY